MINIPYRELEPGKSTLHPALQFLVFTGIFFGVLFAGTLVGLGIVFLLYGAKAVMAITTLDTSVPHFAAALWAVQIMGTTLPIFLAPLIFAKAVINNVKGYIKPGFRFPWMLAVLVFLVMMISSPLIELLSNINQKMVLPHWLQWMRDSEDKAQKMIGVMLNMKTVWDVIVDVILVGLLTAIAEEFMFRGVIQTIFARWTKNVHAAVWITATLFSAFHMEFFGFLPRLLLGVVFGYFVAWSGSIWTSVWAHFINNATAVIATYLFQKKMIGANPDDQHLFTGKAYIFSFAVVFILLLAYRKISLDKKQMVAL